MYLTFTNNLKLFYIFLISVFLLNIFLEYNKYLDFVEEEVYASDFTVFNIYNKDQYNILKLQNKNFIYFTSINKNKDIKKLQTVYLAMVSKDISFYSYLKGFYSKTLYIESIDNTNNIKSTLSDKINNSHEDTRLKELFNTLFLAIPISKPLRDICTNYGISHLIALSGFHLGLISLVIYSIVYIPYSYIQGKYFPYRNKKSDILIFVTIVLFFYLIFTNIVPSLLRSFVMFFLGIIFLRSNIKLLSFKTLFLCFLLIICLFPKFLFSLSFWFSILGVFYIFLYIQYFKNFNKIFSILFFNFWIFFAFNPIVHYFFYTTTKEQLLSPVLTLVFSIFYPFELFLHLISYGDLIDKYLIYFLNYKMQIYESITPLWLFVLYLLFSLFSIINKKSFIILNIIIILFNLYMYAL